VRRATRITAALLGVFAGIGGPEHGVFEIMRGNVWPRGLIITSMGPPCNPEEVWHACEPAMTVIPNFLVTGVLATIVGVITMVWAAAFVHKKRGGVILIALSVALLLVGGGLFPPVIGVVAGITGMWINTPITREPTRLSGFLAGLWPWPLVVFYVWTFGQFVVGHFFNELMMKSGLISPLTIIGLMGLTTASAFGYDVHRAKAT
jgi:hypothetical protein